MRLHASWETCHAARIKFQFEFEFALFISRADYWLHRNKAQNQIAMNEFISLLMKWMHEQIWL